MAEQQQVIVPPAVGPSKMAGPYPLKIEEVYDEDGEEIALYSRGHHTGRRPVPRGGPGSRGEAPGNPKLSPAGVRFETWRIVRHRHPDGDYWKQFHPATPGLPATFPVTVVDLEWP